MQSYAVDMMVEEGDLCAESGWSMGDRSEIRQEQDLSRIVMR